MIFSLPILIRLMQIGSLREDNKVINNGTITSADINIPPLTSKTITINFGNPSLKPSCEYWLDINFKLAKNELWADAGYEIASAQFKVPFNVSSLPVIDTTLIPSSFVSQFK